MEKILELIDLATEPGKMTLEQALEFLEQLATEIDGRIDGCKDDIRNREPE